MLAGKTIITTDASLEEIKRREYNKAITDFNIRMYDVINMLDVNTEGVHNTFDDLRDALAAITNDLRK